MHFERPSVGTGRRPVRKHQLQVLNPGEARGDTARPGDLLTWTNPDTNEKFENLQAQIVYTAQGSAQVRGWVGRYTRDRQPHIQRILVRLEHCVVTLRGGE